MRRLRLSTLVAVVLLVLFLAQASVGAYPTPTPERGTTVPPQTAMATWTPTPTRPYTPHTPTLVATPAVVGWLVYLPLVLR